MTGLRDTLISESTLCFTLSISCLLPLALPLSIYLSLTVSLTLLALLLLPLTCPSLFIPLPYDKLSFVPLSSRIRSFLSPSLPTYLSARAIFLDHPPSHSHFLFLPSPSSKYVYSVYVSPYCIPALFVFTPYHCPCCLRHLRSSFPMFLTFRLNLSPFSLPPASLVRTCLSFQLLPTRTSLSI